jgi:RNA polymerase sigma-70 factor (ECF subfamily)
MTDKWKTQHTLLSRARDPEDQKAWVDFVDYYQGFIKKVVIKMKVAQPEVDDLVQVILVAIWKNLSDFTPDSSRAKFRTWLSKIIRSKAINYFRDHSLYELRLAQVSDEYNLNGAFLSENNLEKIIEKDWRRYLTQQALKNIQSNFSGLAIEVFKRSLRGLPTEKIAQDLGIAKSSVRTLKSRVQRELIKEISNLRNAWES